MPACRRGNLAPRLTQADAGALVWFLPAEMIDVFTGQGCGGNEEAAREA